MSFKSDHPNYMGYESAKFYVTRLPDSLSSALQGFIMKQCEEDERKLQFVINDIAGRVPMKPTTNWGWGYLIHDLDPYVYRLCGLPLPKVMDFLADICMNSDLSFSIDDLNELLGDLQIGYILEEDGFGSAYWGLRENISSRAETIEETIPYVKDIYGQTLEYLYQAREHILNISSDRDRKDAIRNCLSTMESLLQKITGKADIDDATKELRASDAWGPDVIVKEGLSIWNLMHRIYPDIRHGNPKKSDITDEETLYWLERITCFIRYISRVHNR